jgi:arylformamidase
MSTLEGAVKRTVFLDYTQEELDRAYDQRAWVANAEALIARHGELSRAAKQRCRFTTERYGPHADEILDYFPAAASAGARAPVHIFVHGGAWRALTKDESAFAAPLFVESGVAFVALNFSVIPKVRLPEMAEQCRRAIVWLHHNVARLGGDPGRLYLSGHSSGGHLAAVLLTTDWRTRGLAHPPFRAGLCASGVYDLGPVLLSARSSYVKLTKEEESALSPMRHLDRVACPITVAFGDGETPEFKRHARDFAAALAAQHGAPPPLIEGRNLNHFELGLTLGERNGVLGRLALAQIFEPSP